VPAGPVGLPQAMAGLVAPVVTAASAEPASSAIADLPSVPGPERKAGPVVRVGWVEMLWRPAEMVGSAAAAVLVARAAPVVPALAGSVRAMPAQPGTTVGPAARAGRAVLAAPVALRASMVTAATAATAARPVTVAPVVLVRTATWQIPTAATAVRAVTRALSARAVPAVIPAPVAVAAPPETPARWAPEPTAVTAVSAVTVRISAPVPVTVELAVRPAPARRVTALRVRLVPEAPAVEQVATVALAVTASGPQDSAVTAETAVTAGTQSEPAADGPDSQQRAPQPQPRCKATSCQRAPVRSIRQAMTCT